MIDGNMTLTDLPLGNHKVTVSVGAVRGPYSQTVEFTVAEPEPFSFASIAVLVALAITGSILLVFIYRKKR